MFLKQKMYQLAIAERGSRSFRIDTKQQSIGISLAKIIWKRL
jgi:hypothetical protein